MRRSLKWGSAALLAAASLGDGCVLINYDARVEAVEDGGRYLPEDDDGGLDARALDASAPADAANEASSENDASNDASKDPLSDASSDGSSDPPDAAPDADSADAGDGMIACTTNECGGCVALPKSVGTACGACGVGRYACDGLDALKCENDGVPASPGNPALIDDLEDGDENILPNYGLSGEWYMVADSTGGTLTPAVGTTPVPTIVGATGSSRSMHFTATGFTKWGAGMAVSLNAYGCGYDATKQTGLEFHLKGTGSVLVQVATKQTVPVADHGTCTTGCNDLFSVTLTPPSGNFGLRKAVFANLKQAGWGTPATFDPSEILYVQFSSQPSASLDLYIDNLSFY